MKKVVRDRFFGTGRRIGICAPQFVAATIMDPCTFPGSNNLPDGWEGNCRQVLKKFYQGQDLLAAESELNRLITGEGTWGEDVKLVRDSAASGTNMAPLQKVIENQVMFAQVAVEANWKAKYGKLFPKLEEVATRLLTMATQSADVERCCKVHKIVHSKARNRLNNSTVTKLVYCYVNLRLIKNVTTETNPLDPQNDLEDCLASALQTAED